MEIKICKTCGIKKSIEEFGKIRENNYRNECKKCFSLKLKQYRKEYYIKNKEKLSLQNKDWALKHKNSVKEYNKKYYQNNKKRIMQNVNEYRKNNKEKLVKKQEEYNKKRINTDCIYKLKCNIRGMINRSFKRKEYQKNKHTEEIIDCSIDYFINYLLQTFKNNYGYEYDGLEEVHIDHIIPLKYAKTEEEVVKLCHYTNLQLLKAKDNLTKGSKII